MYITEIMFQNSTVAFHICFYAYIKQFMPYYTFHLTAECNFTPSTAEYLVHFIKTYNFYKIPLTSRSLTFVPSGLEACNEIPRGGVNKFAQFSQRNRIHLLPPSLAPVSCYPFSLSVS